MKFTPTLIPEVLCIEPEVFEDPRGFFLETYHKELFSKHGIPDFVQDNQSFSFKGVLRGLHYQTKPFEQAKLVRVVRGEVFDVAVDVRPGSKTFGKAVSEGLSAENKKMLYIPAGFAHGYLTLSEEAEVFYKVSSVYSPEHERGLRWDDSRIAIAWPSVGIPYRLSDRDKTFPGLESVKRTC